MAQQGGGMKVAEVQRQVDDVKAVMQENVDVMLQNIDKTEVLEAMQDRRQPTAEPKFLLGLLHSSAPSASAAPRHGHRPGNPRAAAPGLGPLSAHAAPPARPPAPGRACATARSGPRERNARNE